MPEKRYLLTPGPTPVPPQVLAAMAAPVEHHRGPDFRRLFARCLEGLREIYRTGSEVLVFTASGTGAMEAAVANLCSPGDRVVVPTAGYFGERWASLARAYRCDVQDIVYEWGETPSADDLAGRLAELGGAKAVLLTQSDTSTGVVSDVAALAAAAKAFGALVVVDAVSSLGAVPLEVDGWGVDVAVSGSQKALMAPPGLSFASVSETAWSATETSTSPRYYFDWQTTRRHQQKPQSPFTPAVPIVAALDVALRLLLEDGLEAAFDRHVRLGRACREGVKAMGLELFSPDEDRSAVVTALKVPDGVDGRELVLTIRDSFGVTLAGGQGKLEGKIVRVGHIGWFDVFDIATALAALELALHEAGADIERGTAVTRALDAFGGARV